LPGARRSPGAPRLAEGARILSGPIFLSKQKRPIDRTTLHLLMKKYGATADIRLPLRHFHVLKHCCATHLLSKGFGVERVQDWIGHANIQSTMEYAKVTNARRDDMAQQLEESWRRRALFRLPRLPR